MTDDARTQVATRLAELQSADERLARALEIVAAGASSIPGSAIDAEPVGGLTDAIGTLRKPLPAELGALSAAAERSSPTSVEPASNDMAPSAVGASEAVEHAYVAVGGATGAAATLFTTGRLMFEGAACDVAVDRIKR